MSSLIERAQTLVERAGKLQNLSAAAVEAERYKEQLAELAKRTTTLTGILPALNEVREDGGVPNFDCNKILGIRTQSVSLQQRFQEQSASLLEVTEDTRFRFWEPLKALPKEIKSAVAAAWSIRVELRIAEITLNENLLIVLGNIPALKAPVEELRKITRELQALAQQLPKRGDAEKLTQWANRRQQLWVQLDGGGIPDEILTFLQQAGTKGAALTALTPTILDWLREHHLLNAFAIRINT